MVGLDAYSINDTTISFVNETDQGVKKCYGELQELGVLTVVSDDDKKKSAPDKAAGNGYF